jgi:multiphosphoryl transfer protein
MIGLVIVSHSRALANSLLALIKQVTVEALPIAVAGGVGSDRSEFGTDAVEIMDAIQSVYSAEGVLVMMDLGSAVLSSQVALDLLPEEMQSHIRFCGAPLVEGSIAAAVCIGLGDDLDTVYREATQALGPKNEQLGIKDSEPAASEKAIPAPLVADETSSQVVLTLKNLHGLHARPAARFVKKAASFNATIQVQNLTNGKGPISARSLNALATLGAVKDHQIRVSATGPEAKQALAELSEMVNSGFGELDTPQPEIAQKKAGTTAGPASLDLTKISEGYACVPISEGFALGPLYHFAVPAPVVPQGNTDNPEAELQQLQSAIDATADEIEKRAGKLKATIGEAQAAIFDAHLLILQDPDMQKSVWNLVLDHKVNAALAWSQTIQQLADSYRALSDPYLQQRSVDVMDVGNQVLNKLVGKSENVTIRFDSPVILFSEEITPTETSQLEMDKVLAIITVGGGPTSHTAIIARALSIPAISGASSSLNKVAPGTLLAVDGSSGTLWIDPPQSLQAKITDQRNLWIERRQQLMSSSHELAHLKDGRRVEVVANIGNALDAAAAIKNGAEGVGLLRTEFLFLTRQTPPSEDEQFKALSEIGEVMGARPIVIRTLDAGGDKELPYINSPAEDNPFLGVRAIRLSLQHPDLFISQLRAILRAGLKHPFRIMFPMIATLEEVAQARQWVEKAHQELLVEKIPHLFPIETGIMVEIPSAAVLSDIFAPQVDFFSIGTNDLTQYTMAAERGNPILANLADALHPAILRLIANVVDSAHRYGKWVGVCGELAGDLLAAPILIGLGVDELSMNPGRIPGVKDLLRKLEIEDLKMLANQVLALESASAVRKVAKDYLSRLSD